MKKEIKWKFTKTKTQSAYRVSKWIVDTIMKLSNEDLKQFYLLIENELKKRGEF